MKKADAVAARFLQATIGERLVLRGKEMMLADGAQTKDGELFLLKHDGRTYYAPDEQTERDYLKLKKAKTAKGKL